MSSQVLINGDVAAPEDMLHQALVNYGAYTSFRVENGSVRGLDLHLQRLDRAAEELFGESPGETELRRLMGAAAEGREACWLRVSLFSPEIGHRAPSFVGRPKVMTVAFPPPSVLADEVRVAAVRHLRHMPHLKHTATLDLVRSRRDARAGAFDDALFTDAEGWISEGALWNIGFLKGETVTWPQAPQLAGVTQALIDKGLASVGLKSETRPVRLDEASRFDGAFLCNSATPACAITAIDTCGFAVDASVLERLRAAWASNPPQKIRPATMTKPSAA